MDPVLLLVNPPLYIYIYGYGSIPINTIFRGMNIHLPAILMFTRGTRFWHTAIYVHIYIYTYIYIYILYIYGYSLIKSSLQWNGRLSLGALNQTIPIYIYICIVLHGPFPNAPWVGVSFCLSPGCFGGDGTRFRNLLPVDAKRGGRWDYFSCIMGQWGFVGDIWVGLLLHFWVFKNDFSACRCHEVSLIHMA